MKKPRFRFSVRSLLACTTLVAIYLCVELNRRKVLATVKELNAEGANLILPHEWRDVLWQRLPTKAVIKIAKVKGDAFPPGIEQDAMRHVAQRAKKLTDAGIAYVEIWEFSSRDWYDKGYWDGKGITPIKE